MSKDTAIMDKGQDGNAIQVFPLRPIVVDNTDGAFVPLVLAAAGNTTLTLDVSASAILRWESRDADGVLTPVDFGIDGETTQFETRTFDVVGCSAVGTVRFTIGATDVTITGRRA